MESAEARVTGAVWPQRPDPSRNDTARGSVPHATTWLGWMGEVLAPSAWHGLGGGASSRSCFNCSRSARPAQPPQAAAAAPPPRKALTKHGVALVVRVRDPVHHRAGQLAEMQGEVCALRHSTVRRRHQ